MKLLQGFQNLVGMNEKIIHFDENGCLIAAFTVGFLTK
jgi:hypothetical protein